MYFVQKENKEMLLKLVFSTKVNTIILFVNEIYKPPSFIQIIKSVAPWMS